jgi:hypothetical protein
VRGGAARGELRKRGGDPHEAAEHATCLAEVQPGWVEVLDEGEDVALGLAQRIPPAAAVVVDDQDLARAVAVFQAAAGAPAVVYCASVSPNVRCVSAIVRRTPVSVSDNVRRKPAFIARQAAHHCAPLHLIISLIDRRLC